MRRDVKGEMMAFEERVQVKSGGFVYVVDDSHRAKELVEAGEAVLVFLHAGNRDQDFHFCKYACEDASELDAAYLDKVYRRYRGLPVEILRTKRCIVRETTVEDVDQFYQIYEEPCITEYMDGLYENPEDEREYARAYIENAYGFYDFGIWTVLDLASNEVIGRAGICYREGYEDPELGFVIAKEFQGKGLATEVCRAILTYAKEEFEFERVLAFVQPGNDASVRVCEKLGMQCDGRSEDDKYVIYEKIQ